MWNDLTTGADTPKLPFATLKIDLFVKESNNPVFKMSLSHVQNFRLYQQLDLLGIYIDLLKKQKEEIEKVRHYD